MIWNILSGTLRNTTVEMIMMIIIWKGMVKSLRMKKKDFKFKLKETKVYLFINI